MNSSELYVSIKGYQIYVKTCSINRQEVAYNDVEVSDLQTNVWETQDILNKPIYDDIENLIYSLSRRYGFSNKIKDYQFIDKEGILYSYFYTDIRDNLITPKDPLFKEWKNGEITLYKYDLLCEIETIDTRPIESYEASHMGLTVI